MKFGSVKFVTDRTNQDSLMERAKLLKRYFTKKVVYTDRVVNQNVYDFATLFSSYRFPIVVEFTKETQEYYSYEFIKKYTESLKKAAKTRSYNRDIDEAAKFCYKFASKLVEVCEYLKETYSKSFKNCVTLFNENFGFRMSVPHPLPRLLIHLAYKDRATTRKEVILKKEVTMFHVTSRIFDSGSKNHEMLFAEHIPKLLIESTIYLKRKEDLANILENVEWLQGFVPVILSDLINVLGKILSRLKRIHVSGKKKAQKLLQGNIDRMNKWILKYSEKVDGIKNNYNLFKRFVDDFSEFLETELIFLNRFSTEFNIVLSYQLKNYVSKLKKNSTIINNYARILLEYEPITLVSVKYFLERFFLVFETLYQDRFKTRSKRLEEIKDKNLHDILSFNKNKKEIWKKIFVSTISLEEINRVSKQIFNLQKALT
jgi:hypothetical protein